MEIFKDIPWYEWLYQISNLWNIKSLEYNNTLEPRLLKFQKLKWYQIVMLVKE